MQANFSRSSDEPQRFLKYCLYQNVKSTFLTPGP